MVAAIMADTIPEPRWIPSRGRSQSPMKALMMPMQRSATEHASTDLVGKPACDQSDQ